MLGREIEKLEHGRADHPLVADQGLDDVGILSRERETSFPVPNFASK